MEPELISYGEAFDFDQNKATVSIIVTGRVSKFHFHGFRTWVRELLEAESLDIYNHCIKFSYG